MTDTVLTSPFGVDDALLSEETVATQVSGVETDLTAPTGTDTTGSSTDTILAADILTDDTATGTADSTGATDTGTAPDFGTTLIDSSATLTSTAPLVSGTTTITAAITTSTTTTAPAITSAAIAPAAPASIIVHDAAELDAALRSATGGETILLASGNYGRLLFDSKHIDSSAYADTVTLKALDAGNPPVLDRLFLTGAQNLTFDGLTVDYVYRDGASLGEQAALITNSTNITLRNMVLDGDDYRDPTDPASDGFPTGKGLGINGSQNVTVENCEIRGFWKAVLVGRSSDVVLRGNELTDIRSDGIDLVQIKNVLVEDNYIHDFRTSTLSADHADMIQMWTGGTTERSVGLTLRGNVLDIGDGGIAQMIFLQQTQSTYAQVGAANIFENFVIEDNVVIGNHTHGISVGETIGLTISNNTVLKQSDDPSATTPNITVDATSTGVVITGNVSHNAVQYTGGTQANNFIVQFDDPDQPNYYRDVFIDAATDNTGNLVGLQMRPDSAIAQAGAGSSVLSFDATPDTPTALIAQDATGKLNMVHFDASFSAGPNGVYSEADGTRFLWDFGDGTTGTGIEIDHVYAEAGLFDVHLIVLRPDGTMVERTATAMSLNPELISFDAGDGRLVVDNMGEETVVYTAAPLVTGSQTFATASSLLDPTAPVQPMAPLCLGDGVIYNISRKMLGSFFGTEEFRFSADMRCDDGGELLRQHQTFVVTVQDDGRLKVFLANSTGQSITLTTSPANLTDGNWHKVDVLYDGHQGGTGLKLVVDGTELAAQAFSGSLPEPKSWDMALGRTDTASFVGELSHFELAVNESAIAQVPVPAPQPLAAPAPIDPAALLLDTLFSADHFEVDFAGAATATSLYGDAHIITTAEGPALAIDNGGLLGLGKQSDYQDAEELALRICFARETEGTDNSRLSWAHQRLGVIVQGDGLKLVYAVDGDHLESTTLTGLGLDDTDTHDLVLLRDTKADRMIVNLDGETVLTLDDVDLSVTSGTSYQWGWTVGSANQSNADMIIHEFEMAAISDAEMAVAWDLAVA